MVFHPVFDFRSDELAGLKLLTADQAIAEAAAARDGVLSRRQLAALGVDGPGITRRIRRRSLHRRHHGVYAVGRVDLTRRGDVRAALLRCGRHAAVSHGTAAWLLDLLGPRCRIDLTTSAHVSAPTRGSGIALHFTTRWRPGDIVWVEGFPCTTVERTLADLAWTATPREFGWAWDNADQQTLLDVGRLHAQLSRQRAGAKVLRARLEHLDVTPPAESALEERFLDLCRGHALPPPICQWPPALEDRSGRVDFVFPGKVAVEVDGRRWHAIQAAHDRDRAKDMDLRDAGFDPHRYTWRQVTQEAPRVARIIRAALSARTMPAGTYGAAGGHER